MKNSIKICLVLAVMIPAIHAMAVNRVPLKPDSANNAPCTVFGTPSNGMSCGKITAPNAPIDTVGKVIVSSSTSSNASLCLAGAFQTLPITGYAQGCFAFQLSDHKAYVSTETVAGSQSWVALN